MMKSLFEMARFGENIECGRQLVDIELHGGNDRIYPPHIHIYHTKERKSTKHSFTIEVNLAYYLCTGYLVPCRIYDAKKSIDRKSSTDTSWDGYKSYLEAIEEFLTSGDVKAKYSDCLDNVAVAIHIFNEEADLYQLRAEDKKKL